MTSTSVPVHEHARSGIDIEALDPSVRPQDDLFRHVNGKWLAEHVIPPDRATDGAFRALHDQAERDVRVIIEEAAEASRTGGADVTPDQVRIGALYRSFMDEDRVERLGDAPLREDLAAIDGATTHAELTEVLGELQRTGVGGALGFWVDNDAHDPDTYVVYLTQSGLGLPDESYYREEQHAPVLAAYRPHVARMLRLAGLEEQAAQDAADQVLALETALAGHHWDRVTRRDAEKTYNPMTFGELVERAPGFDWRAWAAALRGPEGALDQVVVREPSYAEGFAQQWPQQPLEHLKSWLTYHVVSARAPYLSSAFVEANFDFYGRTLTGAQELRERWKRGVGLVQAVLGEAVGKVYVERHFPPVAKERMVELVDNLIEAYRRSIEALDWMGPQTRERALAKLEKFTPKIGYPNRWKDYSALELDPEDLVGNVRRAAAFEQDRELGKIGRPVDREEWFMTPQTVNAYYNPGMNEIVFPAAILQPPFFDAEADDAVNYGGIGAVIGHEIGHGFDDQGSKYDGDGRLEDWWTPQDRAEFEARTKALIDQYDGLVPAQLGPDSEHRVNGALTIGENIGDLGGLAIAVKAYEIALAERGLTLETAPVLDGLTGLQRVFIGWAQAWQGKGRDEEVIRRLTIDPHSPDEFRCNTVLSNIDEFYTAFDVQPGDALYRDPAERVKIW